MSGIKPSDLTGGGAFRWVIRGLVVGSLALIFLLRYVLNFNIFIAILISSTILIVGLIVVWLLLVSGRMRVKH